MAVDEENLHSSIFKNRDGRIFTIAIYSGVDYTTQNRSCPAKSQANVHCGIYFVDLPQLERHHLRASASTDL
jgi:hypothetical protein